MDREARHANNHLSVKLINEELSTLSESTYDIVILGAGSGGYATALRAAQLGMTVALIDGDKVGGTCLHTGCIPTKLTYTPLSWLRMLVKPPRSV